MTKRSMGDPLVDGFAFHRRQGSVRERVQCDPFLAIQESALKRASLRKPITASVSPMGNDRAADPARTRTTHTSIQRRVLFLQTSTPQLRRLQRSAISREPVGVGLRVDGSRRPDPAVRLFDQRLAEEKHRK
jgi:hypothetical protein